MLTLLNFMKMEEPPRERAPFQIESRSYYGHQGVYSITRLVFKGCLICGGQSGTRNSCQWCEASAYQWARSRHLLRGRLWFEPYKHILKLDKTKHLKKSQGKGFYYQINFNRDFESHSVHCLIYWINPEAGIYEVFPAFKSTYGYASPRLFRNMEEATAWLGSVLGESLRDWWK